jgi:hypothetical protein
MPDTATGGKCNPVTFDGGLLSCVAATGFMNLLVASGHVIFCSRNGRACMPVSEDKT